MRTRIRLRLPAATGCALEPGGLGHQVVGLALAQGPTLDRVLNQLAARGIVSIQKKVDHVGVFDVLGVWRLSAKQLGLSGAEEEREA